MAVWFTADQHFNHENIITYCDRPFKNANKMEHVITKRFNEKVQEDDTVYIVGDLTLAGPAKMSYVEGVVRKLNGRKIFIVGNHDNLNPRTVHYGLMMTMGIRIC